MGTDLKEWIIRTPPGTFKRKDSSRVYYGDDHQTPGMKPLVVLCGIKYVENKKSSTWCVTHWMFVKVSLPLATTFGFF